MDAKREDSIESGRWRVRVDQARLCGPGTPSSPILLPKQRQGGVLMPDDEPVRVRGFVEECRAVRHGFRSKHFASQAQKADVMREFRYYRKLHGMAGSRTAAREWCAPNRIRDRVDLSRAEDTVDDRKALRVDLFGEG